MIFEHKEYLKFAELTDALKKLCERYPKLTRLESIGKTSEGRDIWMITVTDFSDHDHHERPAVWLDGNTHATEIAGSQACLYLVDLLTSEASQTAIADLLKGITFYVIPRISADGAEHVLDLKGYVRSSPVNFLGDTPSENFQLKDLDGDQEILMMRIKDPSGGYKISKNDPRLMVNREPWDDAGEDFYHLFQEGEFLNFDGFKRRDLPPYRYDLNRQAPAHFSPDEEGAGPIPMWLPEGQAIARAFVARPNIGIAITYHTFGGFLLRPSAMKPDSDLPTPDLQIFKLMGAIGEKLVGYPAVSVYHDFRYDPKKVTTGSWDDWFYHHRGVFSWTPEIWSVARQAGATLPNPIDIYQNPGEETLTKILHWCDQNLEPGSFYRDWRPLQHSQLGSVETGGWRPLLTWSNPPKKFLAEECGKLSSWVLHLARMLPKVQLKRVGFEKTGDVFVLKIEIANVGYLPTNISDVAKSLKVHESPVVRMKVGRDQKILQGKAETFCEHLEGRSSSLPWISPFWGSSVENSNENQFAWTIKGPGRVEFEVSYHGAGVFRTSVSLE